MCCFSLFWCFVLFCLFQAHPAPLNKIDWELPQGGGVSYSGAHLVSLEVLISWRGSKDRGAYTFHLLTKGFSRGGVPWVRCPASRRGRWEPVT